MSGWLNDPRVTVHIQDGFAYVRENVGKFDVIITDSSDPMGKHYVKHHVTICCANFTDHYQRCQLVRFTHMPYRFLRFAWAYGCTMQSLRIFMIFADSNLQSFDTLYSNCCQFAITPDMLREHESK